MAEAEPPLANLQAAARAGDLQARLHLGADCFRRSKFDEAAQWFQLAAEQGSADAQNSLGTLYLNGIGIESSPSQAFGWFSRAAESGLREAHYNLGNLFYNGLGTARDEIQARKHLLTAAGAGHRPALRAMGYLYHLCGGGQWAAWATHCFRQAAEAGDALSKYALALRLWHGHGAAIDKVQAKHWLSAATQDGVWLARQRFAELLADQGSPAVGAPIPACDGPLPECNPPPAAVPAAAHVWQFLSEHDGAMDGYLCDHFINAAAPRLMPSGVVDPKTGATLQSELRTSHSMHFVPSMYDAMVAEFVKHIAAIAELPPAHAEPLGVLRYGPGQEYRPHYDYYTDDRHEGQRTTTVFVYLNDVEEGGGTEFPRLGVRVEPKRGKAVKFFNCDAAGQPDPQTLHAGLPVIRGEKWLATLWFWDRPFIWFR